jgi:acetylglutamate kinase
LKILVKYGGNAMAGGDDPLLAELAELRAAGHAVILVHGGGPEIDEALARRGVGSRRVDGLRVTETDALDIVEAVLCATANKRLVRGCLQRGIPAVGISGQDGGLIRARRATSPSGEDLGFVGEITAIDPAPLQALLDGGFLPIVAPVAISEDSAHAYNVNADTAAGAIAGALRADAYITLTNVARVLRNPADPSSAISKLTIAEAQSFAASENCASGMRPKILAAIEAVGAGVKRAYICAAQPGALAGALAGNATVIA